MKVRDFSVDIANTSQVHKILLLLVQFPLLEVIFNMSPSVGRSVGWLVGRLDDGKFHFHAPIEALLNF